MDNFWHVCQVAVHFHFLKCFQSKLPSELWFQKKQKKQNTNICEPKSAWPHTKPSVLHAEWRLLLVNQGVLHMKWAEEGKATSPGGRSARPRVDEPAPPAGLCRLPKWKSNRINDHVAVIGEQRVARPWLKHGPKSPDNKIKYELNIYIIKKMFHPQRQAVT